MIHMLDANIWIVKVSGEQYLLLAPSEQEARRLAKLVDEKATVSRSGIPLLTVEEDVLSASAVPEHVRKRRENFRRSAWR